MRHLLAPFTLLVLALAACAAPAPEPMRVLSTCDDPAEWIGGSRDAEHVQEGQAALRWEHGKDAAIALRQVPADWSGFDRLSFSMYCAKPTNARFMLILSSENDATEGSDYYATALQLNFTGWKRFRFYLPGLDVARTPLGWNQIKGLQFTASGWGNEPNPDSVVTIDALTLTHEGKEVGPRMSEEELFAALDLTRPGLEKVAEAIARDDFAAARRELAAYYRARQAPKWWFAPGELAEPKPANPNTETADRALRHEFRSIGINHTFGPVIDWNFDKTTEPGANLAPNNEWTWQLNRHNEWIGLSRAYRDTHDEKYAKEFVAQMTAWARDVPMPETSGNAARSAWRTIETGIRAAQIWPELWYRFIHSPAMTDEALLIFLRAYIDHARHLMDHHTSGNWLAMEGNGLYHVGVLFAEFKDAQAWRDTAVKWIYAELDNQVYPDGLQIELSSGYHGVSLGNFLDVFRIARHNELPLPADFLAKLERMYDYYAFGAMPDRRLPAVQDGGYTGIEGPLRQAAELFPRRADFKWFATNGQEGAPPGHTSHAFPYAGYFNMRSGWEPDALYLMLDGGPFGYGHQHEDKLNLVVHAYGKLLLVDPGNYQYERSKWREYFIDSPAHNVVLVDGQPQRRRGKPREQYVVKEPLPHVWVSEPTFDYVEATYDEGFGGEVKDQVSHTRRVLFVKPTQDDPGYWVVLDSLAAEDGKEHRYEALFHFDAPVQADQTGNRVTTRNENEANLSVVARPDAGLALKVVEGQEDPVQGWLPNRAINGVRPAPVAILEARGTGATHLLYVLAPRRAGQEDPVLAVEPLGADGMGARIRLRNGRSHEVVFADGRPATLTRR